ncbi:MAG: M14 family metallopeptidase [Steroidobacteraceae bacterium]
MRSTFCSLVSLLALGLTQAVHAEASCDFDNVQFRDDFEAARLAGCRQRGTLEFELGVAPEDAPINPSAWYAFAIDARERMELTITLVYSHGRHRYTPKLRLPQGDWQRVEPIKIAADGSRASFAVRVPAGRSYIASQPLTGTAELGAWLTTHVRDRRGLYLYDIGTSEQGRPLSAFRTRASRREYIVLLGRQHPPETTGADGLFVFAERLLADDALARRFRQRFGILVVPLLNPDGVVHGQWRNNSRGVDINRDWGPFTQAETRAARDVLAEIARARRSKLALLLDFHSTDRDVLYTQPDDFGGSRAWFPSAWQRAIEQKLGSRLARDASHNPASPTAKTWVATTYSVPAITVEFGDETTPENVRRLAKAAAESAMQLLLDGANQ